MPSILLIEDDDSFRETLAAMLIEHGYDVIQAPDGETGAKLFRAAPADLVITDIVMPNKEGVAIVMELRHDFPKLGIIAISGGGITRNAATYLKLAQALGASHTLKKPFEPSALLAAIEEVLWPGPKG